MNYQTLSLLFKCNKEFSHTRIRKMDFSDTECMLFILYGMRRRFVTEYLKPHLLTKFIRI